MNNRRKHLVYEQRIIIEQFIKNKLKFNDILNNMDVNKSTLYREIKKRRTKINNGTEICLKTNRYPFTCFNCKNKNYCKKIKYDYIAKNAQIDYNIKLKDSRRGVDATINEIEYLDKLLYERLAHKNQSIYHIYKTEKENIGFSLQTIYRYINNGYLKSIDNGHLLRQLSYKPRKKEKEINEFITDNATKIGRKYDNYKEYIKNNPNASVVQMDLVIGKADDKYCIMTLLFTNSNLMLMFLIKKYSTLAVTKIFIQLKRRLGNNNFKRLFEVILTDNGWEFSKPADIEYNYETGEKLVNVFYCNPYSSWQKGKLERNHEFIRYVIPKSISFDDLDQRKVNIIVNNVNNTLRKSLNDLTPFHIFKNLYGHNICDKLNLEYISPKDVDLSYKAIL